MSLKHLKQLSLGLMLCSGLVTPVAVRADVQNLDYGSKEVEITAEGPTAEDALANCERSAIDDVVKHLVQTSQEQEKYQKIRLELLEHRGDYLQRLQIVGKGTSEEGGRYYTILFKVDVGKLHDYLVKAGVIVSEQDLSRALKSPTIAAYYHDPRDQSPYANWSVERINHFLLEHAFHVVDAKVWQDLVKDDALLAQGQGNAQRLGQVLALKAKADLVLEIGIEPKLVGRSGDYTYVQCPVRIRAFEASSGEAFITKVYQRRTRDGQPEALAIKGNVDVSAKAVIEEAVAGAMPMVLEDLTLHWKESLVKGQQYRLIFQKLSPGKTSDLEGILQSHIKDLKPVGQGTYLVRYQGTLGDLADGLEDPLAESLGCQLDSFDLGNANFICS